ncbi:amidohydrolase family protein [Amycolatopsis sp. GM8]|uniref:amidohydrolase family protein n=1 Tax=Amycolatopsis sp. GM8 TaxID=2896530 RepID=UPI001F3B76CC|nr:amidohydrolase family protein [Amycolatopsis sp. GM8]
MSSEKIWANSADSHFVEPETLFDDALPPSLAARMPKSEKFEGYEILTIDGKQFRRNMPKPNPGTQDMREMIDARAPGANDPQLRLKDLDNEGIWTELTFPSIGIWTSSIEDPVLVKAGVQALNDWAHEYIAGASPRLLPTASVPMLSIEDAVAEVERTAALGFRAAFLPTGTPASVKQYHYDDWEPLWAALEAARMVAAFHIGTEPRSADVPAGVVFRGPGGAILNHSVNTFGGQTCVMQLVASGALDRHPNLKVLVSEGGATWGPAVGDRMNEAFRQHAMYVRRPLSKSPKEFIYDQVYASFQHDESAVAAMQYMGWQNVVWGSDYPHLEGTFGHTQETLHGLFDGVPEQVRRRITIDAFNEMFPGIEEPPEG